VSGSNETIVTEIIVDSRGAVKGTEDYEIALRALNRTAEATATTLARRKAAEEEAARTGTSVADVLVSTGRGYRQAAQAADTYLGRLDPIIFAQNALAKETDKVQLAQLGLDKQRLAGKITAEQLATGTVLLNGRLAELATTSAQVGDKTITVADAMGVLKTESERAASSIATITSGMADYVARAADVEAANRRMITSQQAFNAATGVGGNPLYGAAKDARQAGLTSAFVDEYNQTRAALIPLEAETQKYQAQLAAVADAQAKGIITSTEAAQAIDRIYASTSAAVKGMRDFEAASADADQAARRMANAQAAYNAFAGVGSNPLYGDAAAARQADLDAYGASLDALRAKILPAKTALDQLRQTQTAINDAARVGAITEQEAIQAKVRAGQAYDAQTAQIKRTTGQINEATASTGQMKFAVQQLGVQTTQMISGIASGQPVLTTLIQQGHQIGDVMLSSGTGFGVFKTAAIALASALATPVGIIAALTAGLGALALAQNAYEARIGELRNRLSLVRDDFASLAKSADDAAKALAASSFVSVADARTGINAQIQNPQIFKGTLEDAKQNTLVFAQLSNALGETAVDFGRLGQAMKDPAALMQTMLDQYHLKGLTQGFVDHLKVLQAGGETWKATAESINFIAAATKNATEQVSPLGKAWEEFKKAFVGGKTGSDGLLDMVGPTALKLFTDFFHDISTGIQRDINDVNTLIEKFKELKTAVENSRPVTALTATAPNPTGIPLAGPLADAITSAITSAISEADRQALVVNRTPNAQGQISNATGIFQIIPGTADMLRIDAGNAMANISGGMKYIADLVAKKEGDLQKILSAYSANPLGSKGLQDYIEGVSTADTSKLSQTFVQVGGQKMTTAQAIQFWGDYYKMPPEWIAIGMGVAVVESGGKQFKTPTGLPPSVGDLPMITPGSATAAAVAAAAAGRGPPVFDAASLRDPLTVPTTIPPSQNRGMGPDLQKSIDDAKKLADATNVSGAAFESAQAKIKTYKAGLDALDATHSTDIALRQRMIEGLQRATKELYDAIGPVAGLIRQHDLQTTALEKVGQAFSGGYAAVHQATAAAQAYQEVLTKMAPTDAAFATAVDEVTAAIIRETQAKIDNTTATKNLDTQQQIEYVKAETATLNDSVDVRTRELAVFKQRQELQKSGANLDSAASRQALAYAAALADANTQLQINTQALQEIGNLGTQVFDQVGNAITQAFVGGQGAAINFGNVARAVMTSVLQEILKLAILNPILNSVVGGANRTTLDQVLGAIGGGGGSSSGGGVSQLKDLASTGSSVLSGGSSILQALGYQGLGGQINALFGGPGTSLLAGTGLGSGGSIGSAITAFLNTPLYGGTGAGLAGGFASDAAISGGAAAGGFAPVTTLGSLLGGVAGGVGGGFAIGSLSGSLVQGAMNKVGPAPTIGAGTGALVGAGAGLALTLGNPIGALIGGLIGGLAGGTGGGFIGPRPPSTYSGTQIFVDDQGRLTVGLSSNQGTVSNRNATNDAVKALNDFTAATNTAVASLGGLTQLGVGTGADKAADLASAFPRLRFTSPDPSINANIANKGFGSFEELQAAVTRVLQMEAALKDFTTVLANTDAASKVKEWSDRFGTLTISAGDFAATLTDIATFVTQTVPPLLAANDNIGSFATQLKALNDQFNPAIARAKDLGYKEAELTAARDKSIQTLQDAVNRQYNDMAASLINRAADAANKFFGASNDVLKAQALKEFDEAAGKQRDDLATQLKNIFGDSYATTQAFADEIGRLDTALYFERLNAAKQFDVDLAAQDKAAADARLQAAGTAAQAIDSLTQYAISLQTSASSPLSPQDQYSLAQSRFNAVSGAAAAGDYNSIQQLQGYAQTFLDASRTVYGSGASYVSDFQRVLDALGTVTTVSPDTLTASVMQSETRTQTAELVDELDKLKAAVDAVTAQLRQNQQAPDRLAG
jgi:trimeric autotransporter adhesin